MGTPKTIQNLLGLCSIILVSYNVLRQTVLPLARRKQNMVKAPPLPPTFEIHAPKTIGHLLGLVPIYLASTIFLTKSVLKISRGKQNMVKPPPLPPLLRYMHQKQ